jgi:hypothetical protein
MRDDVDGNDDDESIGARLLRKSFACDVRLESHREKFGHVVEVVVKRDRCGIGCFKNARETTTTAATTTRDGLDDATRHDCSESLSPSSMASMRMAAVVARGEEERLRGRAVAREIYNAFNANDGSDESPVMRAAMRGGRMSRGNPLRKGS